MKETGSVFPVINRQETGIHLRKIMDQHGITVKEVQQYLGLGSVQSIYHWLNGISLPSIDNLYALSGLFNLPVDALICGNRPVISPEEPVAKYDAWRRQTDLFFSDLEEMCAA